jgi:hypothetical protein
MNNSLKSSEGLFVVNGSMYVNWSVGSVLEANSFCLTIFFNNKMINYFFE